MKAAITAAVLVAAVGLAGVDGARAQAPPDPVPAQEKPKVRIGEPQTDPEKAREDAIERARKHLGKKLGLEPGQITLESAAAVTWSDASLGCPEKDRMYAQVLTPGHKVILTAAGKTHELHVARTRVVVCKQ
ncbi:MAG TPA: hypothetical protein VK911_12715 [Vicinamibacterales bacterium]|nr:hypothetical protein [Vicinamibacterales bacterium]